MTSLSDIIHPAPIGEDIPIQRTPTAVGMGRRDSWISVRWTALGWLVEVHQPSGEGLPEFQAHLVLDPDAMAGFLEAAAALVINPEAVR